MNKKAKTAVIVLLVLAIVALAAAIMAVIVTKNKNGGKENEPSTAAPTVTQDAPSETQAEGASSGQTEAAQTDADPTEAQPENSSVNLEATQAELDELFNSTETKGSLLGGMDMTMLRYDRQNYDHVYCNFDPATAEPEDYLFSMTHSYLYAYCFGEPKMVTYSESEQPGEDGAKEDDNKRAC